MTFYSANFKGLAWNKKWNPACKKN